MPHMDEGRLQAWIDHPRSGLSDGERAEIEAHLVGCEDCTARVADLRLDDRTSAELLGAIAAAEPAMPEFSEIVARSHSSAPDGAPGRARVRRLPLPWAASIVLAIGVGWMANEVAREEPGLIVAPTRPTAEAVPGVAPLDSEASEAPDGPAAGVEGDPAAGVRENPASSAEALATGPPPVEPPSAAPPAGPPAAIGAVSEPEAARRAVEPAVERQRQAELSAVEQARVTALEGAAARELRRVSEAAALDVARQQPTWVTGRITDPSGLPLSDVVVQIPGTDASALSGADGQYRMLLPTDSLGPGSRIRATFIGYAPASRDLPTGTGELTVEDLRLSPRAVQLEGVVVAGTAIASQRREVSATITLPTLDGTETWRPVSPEDAEQALGVRPLRLPTLPWTEITVLDGASTPVIRVVHESAAGEVVTLYQSRSALDVRGDAGPVRATRTTEGGLHLVVTGDPGQLDLVELLQRAEPIG